MALHDTWVTALAVPASDRRVRRLTVNENEWRHTARELADSNARLTALWATEYPQGSTRFVVRAAWLFDSGCLILELPREDANTAYPGIEGMFPSASRMQRAIHDLHGLRSSDPDQRPWLHHALSNGSESESYSFVRVAGDGVHEIAVGPVHAGTIEPGHFRFSVVGEKVLRLEERLGFTHKGIEQRFTELDVLEAQRLAARVSGDSAVAFSWAYCQALEAIAGIIPPPRASWLRALMLELERIANHLGDLGALGNDAGFAFGLAQFSRLKEQLLRATEHALGQRYLMDAVLPGGTRTDLAPASAPLLTEHLSGIAQECTRLQQIYDEHGGVRDRFMDAGRVAPDLAARLGLIGLAGRASSQAFDLRSDLPCEPYAQLAVRKSVRATGDVAARVAVRFDEVQESCRLARQILERLPAGAHRTDVPSPVPAGFGMGLIEGWRGPVLVALEVDDAGRIHRCHPHDPSWQNWPVIEHAIIGNIVPDFPLINKSFNLSYSGHDL